MSTAAAARALLALPLFACGGGEQEARSPVAVERPQDEILRVGRAWESSMEEKGFRTAPSPISMFAARITSSVALDPGASAALETLVYDETFKVGDQTFQCQARADVHIALVYGKHVDEAAVEMRRPALRIARACNRPGFLEPVLELPAASARFVLRGDRLIPFAPATEKRSYLPVP